MLNFIKKLFQPKKPNAKEAWALTQRNAGNSISNQDSIAIWLYAAPVHLVLQRDSFRLAAPAPLPLESDEIQTLTALLNKHFEADKMVFIWHERQWFLRLEHNPSIVTTALEAAINHDISAYLPTGEGAIQWASITNEMQMLLFEHPINLTREAKGLPVINSIWCYEH